MFLGKEVLRLEAFESQQALLEKKDPSKTHGHAFRKKMWKINVLVFCLLCPQTHLDSYILVSLLTFELGGNQNLCVQPLQLCQCVTESHSHF